MTYTPVWLRVFLCLAAALGGGAARAADAPGDFYRGKTLQIIVGNGAGGIYDIYARLLARYMRHYLPGEPTIIVQNMPSSGSTASVNHVYTVAPQDGTVMGMPSSTAAIQPLLGIEAARFDPRKLHWIGSPTAEIGVVTLWSTVPVNTLDEARQRQVIMGSDGPNGNSGFYAKVINDVFKTRFKLIYGYSGLNESFLAMTRGEVEGYSSAFWNQLQNTQAALINEKKIKFILQYGRAPHPGLAGVPFAGDVPVQSDEDRSLFNAAAAPLSIGYPMIMGPGVPPERVALVRDAYVKALHDPGMIEDTQKGSLVIAPVSGREIEETIATAYQLPQNIVARLQALYYAN